MTHAIFLQRSARRELARFASGVEYQPRLNRPVPEAVPDRVDGMLGPGPLGGFRVEEVVGVSSLKPGTYSFFCSLHPGMKGKLVVQ